MQYVIYFSNCLKNKESKNVKANTNKYLIVGGVFFVLIRKMIFSFAFDLTLKIYNNTLSQKNREAATKLKG